MIELFIYCTLAASLNTTFLIVLEKFGFVEWYEEVRKAHFFPESFCYFCAAFWIGFAEFNFLVGIEEFTWLGFDVLFPFITAGIVQKMIR